MGVIFQSYRASGNEPIQQSLSKVLVCRQVDNLDRMPRGVAENGNGSSTLTRGLSIGESNTRRSVPHQPHDADALGFRRSASKVAN